MAKTCDFKTSEASTKAWMRKRNLLTSFLEIPESNLTHFRQQNSYWSKKAFQRHHQAGIKPGDMLFYEEPGAKKVIPNTEMFHRIDADKGNFYQENLKYVNDIKTTSNISTDIKAGVTELFESNPELANAVYEALGFESKIPDVKYNRTFQNEEYHNAFVKGGLDAVKKIIEENKQKELSAAKQLSREVDLLLEFEELNNKTNKTNRENDRVIELYVILKNSKELDFEYSLKEIGLPNTYVKPIIKVTPQQKQQALQLYSQYLNTIFPDSQVQDIVYHYTNAQKFEKFVKDYIGSSVKRTNINAADSELGIFFGKKGLEGVANKEKLGTTEIPALINIKNPNTDIYDKADEYLYSSDRFIDEQEIDFDTDIEEDENGNIKVVYKEKNKLKGKDFERAWYNSYKQDLILQKKDGIVLDNIKIAFEPEQIHILGSKKDIEGFKKFANNTSKELSDKFVDDLYNLNLTPEVITYLYNENGSTHKLLDYGFMLKEMVNSLKSQNRSFVQILDDIKCL